MAVERGPCTPAHSTVGASEVSVWSLRAESSGFVPSSAIHPLIRALMLTTPIQEILSELLLSHQHCAKF